MVIDANGGIVKVHSTLMRNTASLDGDDSSTRASLDPGMAMAYAESGLMVILATDPTFPDGWIENGNLLAQAGPAPELLIYDPAVMNKRSVAPPVLVWKVRVTDISQVQVVEEVYVDANNGDVVAHETLIARGKQRHIWDAECTDVAEETYVLGEGAPGGDVGTSCNSWVDPQACRLYKNMGLIFDLFQDVIVSGTGGLEGWDPEVTNDLTRGSIKWTRTTCVPGYQEALFTHAPRIVFGWNMATKDVVGHEWTHGVTYYAYGSSSTDFTNQGAINESFADIFGEFMDLLNEDLNLDEDSPDEDSTAYRWKIGETSDAGVIRNMANPKSEGHPDQVNGTFWNSIGQMHEMAGPSNKTAHLLAAGDSSFYGSNYTAFDIDLDTSIKAVANLYYQVIVQDMMASDNYEDLANHLENMVIEFVVYDNNWGIGVYGGPGPGGNGIWDSSEVIKVQDALDSTGLWTF